jgi:hypothetical protein
MVATRPILALLVTCLIAIAAPAARSDDAPARNSPEPPAYDEFLVIPLRVHILSAPEVPEIDCHLTDADIARIRKKVNGIWHAAGIHWGLDSLVREPAARTDRFLRARELLGGSPLGLYRILLPDESRMGNFMNIYYIHEFPVNGVWLGREAVVKETAMLREVEGGIDEPIPRVTAHELGHALKLSHREDRTNLLASGTTGTLLNSAEIKSAREGAHHLPGAMTVGEVRERAEAAEATDDRLLAIRLWTWLLEIPGTGVKTAQERLDRLNAKGKTDTPRPTPPPRYTGSAP